MPETGTPYRRADDDTPVPRYAPEAVERSPLVLALATHPTFVLAARQRYPDRHVTLATADLYYALTQPARDAKAMPEGNTLAQNVEWVLSLLEAQNA